MRSSFGGIAREADRIAIAGLEQSFVARTAGTTGIAPSIGLGSVETACMVAELASVKMYLASFALVNY